MTDAAPQPLNGAAVLVPVFAEALQHIAQAPHGDEARIVAGFAMSLVGEQEFDLSQIERLEPAGQAQCLRLFDYCMAEGMTEDERSSAFEAFQPYTDIHVPGMRH